MIRAAVARNPGAAGSASESAQQEDSAAVEGGERGLGRENDGHRNNRESAREREWGGREMSETEGMGLK